MNIQPHSPIGMRWLEILGSIPLLLIGFLIFLFELGKILGQGLTIDNNAWVYLIPPALAVFAVALIIDGLMGLRKLRAMYDAPLTKSPQELTSAVQHGLGFTPEDLDANQNGLITPRQRAILDAQYKGKVDLQVKSAEGVVRLDAGHSRNHGISYELKIGGERLKFLTKQQYEGFWSGAAYRIYYVPHVYVPTLLSAEFLGVPGS